MIKKIFFALMILFAAGIPGWIIVKEGVASIKGKTFRFHMALADPYDAFSGRYLRLRYDREFTSFNSSVPLESQRIYVSVKEGADGFARVEAGSAVKPKGDEYFITREYYSVDSKNVYQVRIPFDRYYMNEEVAPEAEKIYFEEIRSGKTAYALVKIYKGTVIVDDIIINNRSIDDLVKEKMNAK